MVPSVLVVRNDTLAAARAEDVAVAEKDVGAKLIHISAIGADRESNIPYARTKALDEEAVRVCKDATMIRPSVVLEMAFCGWSP